MPIGEPSDADPWRLFLIEKTESMNEWAVAFYGDSLDSFYEFLTYLDCPIRITSREGEMSLLEIFD